MWVFIRIVLSGMYMPCSNSFKITCGGGGAKFCKRE